MRERVFFFFGTLFLKKSLPTRINKVEVNSGVRVGVLRKAACMCLCLHHSFCCCTLSRFKVLLKYDTVTIENNCAID